MSSASNLSSTGTLAFRSQFSRQFLGDNGNSIRAGDVDFAGAYSNASVKSLSPVQQGELLRGLDQITQCSGSARSVACTPSPQSIRIIQSERQLLQSGTIAGVNAFWQSRFERGDPVAITARQFGLPRSQMDGSVQIADNKLRFAVNQRIVAQYTNNKTVYRTEYYNVRDGEGGSIQRPRYVLTAKGQAMATALYNKVRVDLANAHASAIGNDGRNDHDGVRFALNVDQVYTYHKFVFASNGLPVQTFGGSPIFGSRIEAWATSAVGLWGSGYDPN